MHIDNPQMIHTWTADGAVTRNRFVETGTNDEDAAMVNGLGDQVIGVALETAADNASVQVAHGGIVIVDSGAAVTRGNLVRSDASGRAVAYTPGVATATRAAGVALESAAGAGERISILLIPGFGATT